MALGIRWHDTDFQRWSDKELIEQIDITDKLIDLDYIGDSVFIDDILELSMILRDECVRRVRSNAV